MSADSEIESLKRERDLYRRLLELGAHDELVPFLDEALSLIVDITHAHKGYLAIDPHAGRTTVIVPAHTSGFWIARGFTEQDINLIRSEISSGIILQALRTGKTVSTGSAQEDPRFKSLESVQLQKIKAVLCAPITLQQNTSLGVLYLQGRDAMGPFPEGDRRLVEAFAQRIAPLTKRLADRSNQQNETDHTKGIREKLNAHTIIGKSRSLAETLRQLSVATHIDAPVLILGESGTGKTDLAHTLHRSSRRASQPFIEINCAALPENLIEAELFGAEKGSHSTATQRMPGKIAAAEGGTLFLDELTEMPINAQSKLLQFLQSQQYYLLGSTVAHKANVRVVAATNTDIQTAIKEKRLREDLYYRLNVFVVRVTPLRERTEDIALLAEHFVKTVTPKDQATLTLTWEALWALQQADWPGNVRELFATIQRGVAFALSESSEQIHARHLFPEQPIAPSRSLTYQESMRLHQKRVLTEALHACDGNISEVARRLDLARSHLHELLRAHGVSRTVKGSSSKS